MNKKLRVVLITLLVGSMTLGTMGCSSKATTGEGAEISQYEDPSVYNEAGTFPVLKEPVKLTIGMAQDSLVTDYDNNKFTKYLEEKMNIDLEFIIFPAQDAAQKLSVMINAGDELPDIINMNLNSTDAEQYGSMGAFIPLNDYYENSSYYLKELMENPDYKELVPYFTSSDGNIYTVPKITLVKGNIFSRKAWINKTWLDQFGLSVPQTTEEFYTATKTFIDNDANGNGKKDEIPFVGNTNGWSQQAEYFLMNSFIYCNPSNEYLVVEDGKVDVAYAQDEWKQGLEYMNKLCSEGIFSPLSFTQDSQQFKALIEGPEEQTIGGFSASRPQYPVEDMRKADFVVLPPLEGPNGQRNSIVTDNGLPVSQFHITKDCKNPEVAFKLADLMNSEEASMFQRFGELGVDWKESSGTPLNEKAKYNVEPILAWGEAQNSHWQTADPHFVGDFLYTESWDGEINPKNSNYYAVIGQEAADIYEGFAPEDYIGRIIYTPEELEEIIDIKTTLRSYVDEQMVAFITGNKKFSEWDAYLEELNIIGVERYLEVTQQAYDRMMK